MNSIKTGKEEANSIYRHTIQYLDYLREFTEATRIYMDSVRSQGLWKEHLHISGCMCIEHGRIPADREEGDRIWGTMVGPLI